MVIPPGRLPTMERLEEPESRIPAEERGVQMEASNRCALRSGAGRPHPTDSYVEAKLQRAYVKVNVEQFNTARIECQLFSG